MTAGLARRFCDGRGSSSAECVHRLVTPRDRLAADAWPQRPAAPDDRIASRSVASSALRLQGGTSDGTPSSGDVEQEPSRHRALSHARRDFLTDCLAQSQAQSKRVLIARDRRSSVPLRVLSAHGGSRAGHAVAAIYSLVFTRSPLALAMKVTRGSSPLSYCRK